MRHAGARAATSFHPPSKSKEMTRRGWICLPHVEKHKSVVMNNLFPFSLNLELWPCGTFVLTSAHQIRSVRRLFTPPTSANLEGEEATGATSDTGAQRCCQHLVIKEKW